MTTSPKRSRRRATSATSGSWKPSSSYDRAALRRTVRYARETPGITVAEAQALLALLAMLPTRPEHAAHPLADLLYCPGLERACEALNAWAGRTARPR